MIVDELFVDSGKLSVKARTTFLQYKVLTESSNLELDLVKSKINQESEKYFESILSKLQILIYTFFKSILNYFSKYLLYMVF